MVATAKKARAKGAGKAFTSFRKSKTGRKIETVVTQAMKKELEKKIRENPTIGGLAMLTINASKKFKTPNGIEGRSLNVLDTELVDVTSAKSTSESSCLYFYRPHRSKHPAEALDYDYKQNKALNLSSTTNFTGITDISGMVASPVKDDPDDGTRYSNISLRQCFDLALLQKMQVSDTTTYNQKETSLQLHLGTYTSTLQVVAPTAGAIVDIYDLKPKFTLGPTSYQNQYYATGYMSPYYCFSEGMTETIEPLDSIGSTTLGSKPTDSVLFKRTWDVIKKTTVRMTDSSIHRHRTVFGINKTVAYQEMATVTSQGGMLPWMPCHMVVVRGYAGSGVLAQSVTVNLEQESNLTYKAYPGDTSKVIVYDNRT